MDVLERPGLVVVTARNVGVLERSPIHKVPQCLAIVVVRITLSVVSPDPPTILRLDTRGIFNRVLSPLGLEVMALVDEAQELTTRDSLESGETGK